MTTKIKLINIDKLRAHEKVSPQRVVVIRKSIKRMGMIKDPVIIDKQTKIILDGHHRVESLKNLSCRLVPVMEVEYFSNQVRVVERRGLLRGDELKALVLDTVERGGVMRQKSTKHLVKGRILGVKIKLDELK